MFLGLGQSGTVFFKGCLSLFWNTYHFYGALLKASPVMDLLEKGNRGFADLRYGEEDSISPSTQIFPTTKS